ncbi:MAG: class I SAM-dependent DNA methyltransferase [Candidatus Hodarchaeota archaeon]
MSEINSTYHRGRIYENYIATEHRHRLGQYFTHPSLTEFINGFCINDKTNYILDPSCGVGIFLISAFHHLKRLNQNLPYNKIIDRLWGVEIERIPAQDALINLRKLVMKQTKSDKIYPNIINQNFFDLKLDTNLSIILPDGAIHKKSLPLFDVIIGNPPYTRQEEIRKGLTGSKRDISIIVQKNCKVDLPRRSSLYAYFLAYSLQFLRDKGRLGFIIPSNFITNHFSIILQQELLLKTKIIACIESQVESWFHDPSVNTMIIILEKNNNIHENLSNSVKFVQLKKSIIRANSEPDFTSIEKLIDRIENTNKYDNNAELRIFNIPQQELYKEIIQLNESRNKKSNSSAINSWAKYLRGSPIFFKVNKKAEKKLVPLGSVVNTRFSVKTGANKFFILTKEQIEQEGIEKEFWTHKTSTGQLKPNKIINSLRESKSVRVNPTLLTKYILLTKKTKKELEGTNFLKYVLKGEEKGFHKRKTCATHLPDWYCLKPDFSALILYAQRMGDRFLIPLIEKNIFVNKNLHSIMPHEDIDVQVLGAILNSSITHLFHELNGRLLIGAQNVIDSDIRVINALPILDPRPITQNLTLRDKLIKAFEVYSLEEVEHIFKELGTENPEKINLMNIKPHKLALDTVLFDYIGLNSEDVKQIYASIIERVISRKQKSVNKKRKGRNNDIILKNRLNYLDS